MTDDRANLKVSREFYERHKETKAPGQTWEEYFDGEVPERADVGELATEVVDMIGAEAGGPQVDDSEIAREVVRSLDYEHLSQKVAEKVVADLR